MSIKGTQTEKNLLKSFAGESQARNRYTYFASVARDEGFQEIATNFLLTAEQEKAHAKRMFKYLEGGVLEITVSYPAGVIGTTLENLKAAAGGEHEEWSCDYPKFAEIAAQEGFPDIADMYRFISRAEAHHEERYRQFIGHLESGDSFKRPEPILWECLECGYIHEGVSAPGKCPACQHPQAYYRPKANIQ